MSLPLPKIIDRALVFLVAFFIFLVPVFFLSLTGEYFEFNKQALLAVLVVVGYSLLAVKMLLNRQLIVIRTRLDLPIFLLLLVYLASSLFSISPAVSFLGEHGVFHGGLLSLFLYIALFYLVVNAGQLPVTSYQLPIIASSFFLSLLAILQYFEIYFFPWPFTHQRFWTPMGGIRTLIVYLLVTALLAIGTLMRVRGIKRVFPCLVLLTSLGAVFLVSGKGEAVRSVLPEKYQSLPSEVTLDWQTSWQIANSVLGVRPLFGSGPGTFFSDFTRFKPQSFNQKIYWNIRFDRAANEWFETLATLGLGGISVYIFLWSRIIRLSVVGCRLSVARRSKPSIINHQPLTILPLLAFFIFTFFCPLTTATAVLFWVLLALFVAESGLTEKFVLKAEMGICPSTGKKLKREIPLQKLLFSVYCFLFTVFGYLYFFCYYRAETHYRQATAEFSQDRETAFVHALSAAKLNPLKDVYQIGLATASLGVASPLSQQASPSAQLIEQLVGRAIAAGNKAIQLNPENVRNWENSAGLYQNLLPLDPNAEQQVVNSFNQAISLDPVNPVLRNQLANFLLQRGKIQETLNQLFLAIRLKPDYSQAHYDLAQAYRATGDFDKARQELETVLLILPQDAPEKKQVESELQELVSKEATPTGNKPLSP